MPRLEGENVRFRRSSPQAGGQGLREGFLAATRLRAQGQPSRQGQDWKAQGWARR